MYRCRAAQGIEMSADRRRSERRLYRGLAKVQFGVGSLPRDCLITDVSDGGARIIAENLEIPAEFTIIFSTGRPRQCRLVWRIGCEFGAEFIDGALR
jgi:PilZ domain